MISASIAETHRFGRVRKNGYDPAEVDAVVARLVDALRQNDERIDALTKKIDAADASADAIRKTFVAAEATSTDIIDTANAEATSIVSDARTEADELARTSEELQTAIATRRDRILTEVYAEAETRMVEIERQTAERTAEAEWAIQEAIEIRNRTVSETEAEAESIVHAAETRAAMLRADITSMAQKALALERAAAALAESAQEGASVLDLTAIEGLEDKPDETVEHAEPTEPEIVIDDAPMVSSSDDDWDASTDHDISEDEEDQGPRTRYQQSTGVPLKERIKIARASG
jgi:DivIVA domain-containing protein